MEERVYLPQGWAMVYAGLREINQPVESALMWGLREGSGGLLLRGMVVPLTVLLGSTARGQVSSFPYIERFDSAVVPALPPGWSTSTQRSSSGDFVSTTSSPRSAPQTLLSTNSTVAQFLISPRFDFTDRTPEKLEFFTARSGTHLAGVLIEASLDDGVSFPITVSDTLRNPGATGYLPTSLRLPASLSNQTHVRIRWRVVGGAGGTTGTFRLDDITLTTLSTYDLGLTGLTPIRVAQQDGQSTPDKIVGLRTTVKNFGQLPAGGYAVRFFKDADNNGVADERERFASVAGTQIPVGDSAIVDATMELPGPGNHRYIAVVAFPQDTNPANDTATVLVPVSAERNSMIINEIMVDPLTGQNEWIEFFNRSPDPIDLAGWRFSDRPTAGGSVNTFVITTQSHTVQPGDFVVAAAESSILSHFPLLRVSVPVRHVFILNRSGGFSFGNDGDAIILRDQAGPTIDSVLYSSGWHHPDVNDSRGRSLERINQNIGSNDPHNWSTSASVSGGTPGERNSIYTPGLMTNASLSFNPNPFSPDGDGFEDFCLIRYHLPLTTSLIRITIFDTRGRAIRTLANADLAGPTGEVIWDGFDTDKQRVRIGLYIMFLEAVDGQGGIIATAKGVVVVATKL